MLIMREHRNAKWDRKSGRCAKESVGDSDKFSRPFALLTENIIPELKLQCQTRSEAGHGGTCHCNEMWNGEVWSLIWVLGICTLAGVMSFQFASVLAVPSSFSATSSTAEAFFGAIPPSGGHSPLSHICNSLSKQATRPLWHSTSLRQLAEQITAVPWLLPESHSHSIACLCTAVRRTNTNPFIRQCRKTLLNYLTDALSYRIKKRS